MRRFKIATVSTALILGGMGIANAGTFDGTNMNPEYQTGITEVYAKTDQGNDVYIPVWSMADCAHEDGSSQVACVWNSLTRGNGFGIGSFLKLGDGQTATISNEAARVLTHGEPVAVPAPVVVPEAVPEAVETLEAVQVGETVPEAVEDVTAPSWDHVDPAEDGSIDTMRETLEATEKRLEDEAIRDECMNAPEYSEIDCIAYFEKNGG